MVSHVDLETSVSRLSNIAVYTAESTAGKFCRSRITAKQGQNRVMHNRVLSLARNEYIVSINTYFRLTRDRRKIHYRNFGESK